MILIEGHTIETNLSFCSRLTVETHIGGGRYGDVYKVVDPATSKCYALKHIRFGKNMKKNADTDQIVAETIKNTLRIGNEAFLNVSSPYVVKNYGLIRLDDLEFGLLFEYVEGEDLEEWLEKQSTIPWDQKETLFLKILEGVQAIHQKNIIHHDLKPQNILIDQKGNPKILDFGLSTFVDKDFYSTKDYKGTPAYIAPENFIGVKTTGRFDIYSLGCILYQMYRGGSYIKICGFDRPPLDHMLSKDGSGAGSILTVDEKFPNTTLEGKRVANVIGMATQFNPAHRYSDISSFIKDLRPSYQPTVPPVFISKMPPPPKLKIVKVPDKRYKPFKVLFLITLPILIILLFLILSVLVENGALRKKIKKLTPYVGLYESQSSQNAGLETRINLLQKKLDKKRQVIKNSFFKVGKQPFAAPSNFASGWRQFFRVIRPIRIHNVLVYPKQEGYISIYLYNIKNEYVTQSERIHVKSSQWQRVELNFSLKPGRYYFSLSGICSLAYSRDDLYYPYQIDNLIQITGANPGTMYNDRRYYLYFYEWIVSPELY